jgi:hypothetical protein
MEHNDYHIINLNFARAEQPKYWERAGQGSRVDFGQNNSYPTFLNELYEQSPKHGAIVRSKATYIYGNGLNNLSGVKCNDSETWNDILRKAVIDFEKFGGYALQIIWNRAGTIASVYHIKYHKVRTNYDNSKFWVKDEWDINRAVTKKEKQKEREYLALDVNNRQGTQILYIKSDGDQNDIYPLPSYFQAINYIDADRLISQHILGMAKDGFVASKLINFNNGEPSIEQKKAIEQGLTKKFTGADGKRFMVMFNKGPENAASVTDLGATMLTKEDFTNVNNLIQQEIYAAHQITSPILFGIKTEGQLGGRSEMRDAYEIFKNTYVNNRQKIHEEVFNGLLKLADIQDDRKIVPVEPIGIDITEAMIVALGLPKKYFLDKLGINPEDYPEIEQSITAPAAAPTGQVNENLKKLSAREFQQLQRVVRDYTRGRIKRQAAVTLLKSSYGLSDDEVMSFLGDESEQQFQSEDMLPFFEAYGETKHDFILIKQTGFSLDTFPVQFEEQVALSKLEANILNLISKDKRITAEVISDVVKKPVNVVERIMQGLIDSGYITESDGEKKLTKPLREITETKPSTTQILVRYSYEGPKDDRNRPFCARLLELDKFYSREDIERLSERLGYSVWDRRGGWWTQPDGSRSPSCRHEWKTNIVLRKKP